MFRVFSQLQGDLQKKNFSFKSRKYSLCGASTGSFWLSFSSSQHVLCEDPRALTFAGVRVLSSTINVHIFMWVSQLSPVAPFCPSLQPHSHFPRPLHPASSQTPPPAHLFLIPQVTPVGIFTSPFSPVSCQIQYCFVPLLSSLWNLNPGPCTLEPVPESVPAGTHLQQDYCRRRKLNETVVFYLLFLLLF